MIGLYRCVAGMNIHILLIYYLYYNQPDGDRHFFSTQHKCEGDTTQSLLGFISPIRGRETLRGLYLLLLNSTPIILSLPSRSHVTMYLIPASYRCFNHTSYAFYHSLDLACPPADQDVGLLGYVRWVAHTFLPVYLIYISFVYKNRIYLYFLFVYLFYHAIVPHHVAAKTTSLLRWVRTLQAGVTGRTSFFT